MFARLRATKISLSQRERWLAQRDGEGFSSPLTRFAGAPPEGEPFVNRRTIPLSVILSGGGAVVELLRIERSE